MYTLAAYVAYIRKAIIHFATGGGIIAVEAYVPGNERQLYALLVLVVGALIHYKLPNAAAPGSVPAEDDDGTDDDDAQLGASDEDIDSVDPVPTPQDPGQPAAGTPPRPQPGPSPDFVSGAAVQSAAPAASTSG